VQSNKSNFLFLKILVQTVCFI